MGAPGIDHPIASTRTLDVLFELATAISAGHKAQADAPALGPPAGAGSSSGEPADDQAG